MCAFFSASGTSLNYIDELTPTRKKKTLPKRELKNKSLALHILP